MINIEDIKYKLEQSIGDITHLDIIDNSYLHFGHGGYKEGIITHIKIVISALQFAGLNKIKQHQLVFNSLKELINNPLHAIEIEVVNNN